MVNIIDIARDSWLFDDQFKAITGPLIVAISLWSIRSIRLLFFPFFWIFRNNLSSGYFKLSVDNKIHALKIISEYRDGDKKSDILMSELKLKQYGLYYPLPILRVLFEYVHDNDIRMNNTGFLSFLDCYLIFDYNRKTMPTYSLKKIITHILAYVFFVIFLCYYISNIFDLLHSLYNTPMDFINIIKISLFFIISILVIRIIYIILENMISFFWAIMFSEKLKKYSLVKEEIRLIEKYKP